MKLNRETQELTDAFWNAPEDSVWTQKLLAALTDQSEAKCERARWEGSGPRFIKLGRHVRYRKRDILHWLETRNAFQNTAETSQDVTESGLEMLKAEMDAFNPNFDLDNASAAELREMAAYLRRRAADHYAHANELRRYVKLKGGEGAP